MEAGIDLAVVIIGILTNLLLAVMFSLRAAGRQAQSMAVGGVSLALSVPLAGALLYNLAAGRPWWTFVLPAPLLVYDAIEYWLDYERHYNFRETNWLGPYLALYYTALMLMIGYAFLVGRPYGYAALTAYFVNQVAALASYRLVGHG